MELANPIADKGAPWNSGKVRKSADTELYNDKTPPQWQGVAQGRDQERGTTGPRRV
jgi:hypothetical protein